MLEISNLTVSYHDTVAVEGIDLRVPAGEMTAVVGQSGSGKSTTALAALGLLPRSATINSGTISIAGKPVTPRETKALLGNTIGLVPQDPNNSLNPLRTIGASVGEGLAIHGRPDKQRVLTLLERVGIDDPERRYHQYPHELSGGMKQRALIAAAVALEPELIIADEPTSALDVTVQKQVLDLLDEMREELGLSILFITHDLAVAGDRADHIVVMENGRVRETGLAANVLNDPQDDYTRRLLADAPSLAIDTAGGRTRPAPTGEPLVDVDGLTQRFGDFTAVDNVSFSVARGSTHAIVGESGSGKTTLGRMITGFTDPVAGTINLGDQPLPKGKDLRRAVQLVYQNPYSSLNPRHTISRIIAEPLRNLTDLSADEINRRVDTMLERVGLPGLGDRKPDQLSGGQRQRVAIARALIVEPELVVLDEAVSALDVTVQAQILTLLDDLQRELGLTYIFISHDLAVVHEISDTVSVMSRGKQVEYGPTAEVFANPTDDFTRRLLDAIPGARFRHGDYNLGL